MSIGYACLTTGIPDMKLKTCILKNANLENLEKLIFNNLKVLDRILDYNIENEIKLFRISSDIIPFGSHYTNTLKWWNIFSNELTSIGRKAQTNGIRLSMHPGQYTVLNSPNKEVVDKAIDDLKYHCRFLDSLGLGYQHKLILHIGGIYGDKTASIKRFIKQYHFLDSNIQSRLVIENDDKQYNISDVLSIGKSENIPVVFDNLHHQVNKDDSFSENNWISKCSTTWNINDGSQKIHYSQQNKSKRPGAHSYTLDLNVFLDFYNKLPKPIPDIMLEVKDKNLSAIKCITGTEPSKIKRLEIEWSRYKYLVLEHSPKAYNQIRELLKDKKSYPVREFYTLIDEAMSSPLKLGNAINAAQHIWGYINSLATEKDILIFKKGIENLDKIEKIISLKRHLWKLVNTYQQKYLINSLYFAELYK